MKALFSFCVLALMLSGCATGITRNGTGLIYTDAKDSVAVSANSNASKSGMSCGLNILGLVSTGDMSIDAAKKAGDITRVASVDYSQNSLLGVYTKTCTIVRGE